MKKRTYTRRIVTTVGNPGDRTQAMFSGIIRAVKKAESLASEGNTNEASKILFNLSQDQRSGGQGVLALLASSLNCVHEAQTRFKAVENLVTGSPN
jgi:hypothetical protein